MGIMSFMLDIYENMRKTKSKRSEKKYDADSSDFTGSRKNDLEKFRIESTKTFISDSEFTEKGAKNGDNERDSR